MTSIAKDPKKGDPWGRECVGPRVKMFGGDGEQSGVRDALRPKLKANHFFGGNRQPSLVPERGVPGIVNLPFFWGKLGLNLNVPLLR